MKTSIKCEFGYLENAPIEVLADVVRLSYQRECVSGSKSFLQLPGRKCIMLSRYRYKSKFVISNPANLPKNCVVLGGNSTFNSTLQYCDEVITYSATPSKDTSIKLADNVYKTVTTVNRNN